MDGIDGIAGGQAVVAGLGWAALGYLTDQPLIGLIGLLLAAAVSAFSATTGRQRVSSWVM